MPIIFFLILNYFIQFIRSHIQNANSGHHHRSSGDKSLTQTQKPSFVIIFFPVSKNFLLP